MEISCSSVGRAVAYCERFRDQIPLGTWYFSEVKHALLLQVLLDQSLAAAVWVYGGVCICAAVCASLLPIETMGKELPVSQCPQSYKYELHLSVYIVFLCLTFI